MRKSRCGEFEVGYDYDLRDMISRELICFEDSTFDILCIKSWMIWGQCVQWYIRNALDILS
jgi:hypothetical protein